jgi:hypothetical protein
MVVTLVLENEAAGSVGPGSLNCFFGGSRQVAVSQAAERREKMGKNVKSKQVFYSAPRRSIKIRKQNARTSTILEVLQGFVGQQCRSDGLSNSSRQVVGISHTEEGRKKEKVSEIFVLHRGGAEK